MKTFGEIIAEARKGRGLTQRALSAQLKKPGGATLGLAYINNIEHNRRNPPAPHFVAQLAAVLGVPPEVLRFYARRLDEELLVELGDVPHARIVAAYAAFKRELRE